MPYVLIVDDEGAVRQMIVLLLRSHGYETETATDGAEALTLMRQRRPCLVLLDIKMPGMDGREFRERQLEDPALADVPVIGMTGMVHPEDDERKLGIQCLGKPIDFPSLIRAVEKFCGPPPLSAPSGWSGGARITAAVRGRSGERLLKELDKLMRRKQ